MAFIPITPELVENVTLALHPKRTFISSSSGVTGSIRLVNRPSVFIKKSNDATSVFAEGTQDSINSYTIAASREFNAGSPDVSGQLESYLNLVNSRVESEINSIKFDPIRYVQPVNYTNDNGSPFLLKTAVRDVLMPYYRHGYSICDFSCGNYHTLNFFSSSLGSNDTALIYANTNSSLGRQYTPSGPFSLDFFINPRYLALSGTTYSPGTILHLSSTFALSLVTGSSKDNNQNTDGFRLLLQLSQSADIAPSTISIPSVESGLAFPNNLIFVSEDNSLTHNKWHHVTVRWGGLSRSYGTGSIVIDGNETYFNVPSASISNVQNPAGLVIGNYFQGSDDIGKFFNSTAATSEGVPSLPGYTTDPVNFTLNNQLQAEVHDLKIYNRFLSNRDVDAIENASNFSDESLLFYVPPLFSTITPERNVLVTPFQEKTQTTYSPFNVDLSFGVNGYYMNLENFVKDHVTANIPRLYNLTASVNTADVVEQTANQILYQNSQVAKRNLLILPNDNGLQKPDFAPIIPERSDFFLDDLSCVDHSLISMKTMLTGAFYPGLPSDFDDLGGATPEAVDGLAGPALTIAQRFKDTSSNQVVLFDISNLGYGTQISPGTFSIIDNDLSGSGGSVKITLKDDGQGMLYRADADTTHCKWSAVGNIFYNEGIIVLTSPTMALFAKNEMTMSFHGEQRTPVMVVNVPCPAGLINSSSNPTYEAFPVTQYPNEREDRFVYISGINLHDENLNVIMRANLAQPIAKRESDEFMFRIKYDF
jgi:hypothetical protein